MRMRAVRERRHFGIRRFWLEVDVSMLEHRLGEFESDEQIRDFMNELIDEAIMNL